MAQYPTLRRDLQLIPTTVEGRRAILFVDPLQFAPSGLTIDMEALPVLQLLDGRHDLRDIQTVMMRGQGGRLVPLADVESLLRQLDDSLLLESDAYRERYRVLREEFTSLTERPPSHGGKSYDDDPAALRRFISDSEQSIPPGTPDFGNRVISGLVSPHIDIRVAGETYIGLYRHLRDRRYDLVVILGINHQWQDGPYCLTTKNYRTPIGTLPTDADAVEEVKKRVSEGTLASTDFGHRLEHSIEFQAVFLSYYLAEPVPVMPILCGGLHELIMKGDNILQDRRFREMAEALRRVIDARKRVLLVAGVDFSHVGLKFGDPLPAERMIESAREHDDRLISALRTGMPEKIVENEIAAGGRYNVCGFPALVLFSVLMGKSEGTLLAHETYAEEMTGSAVTYVSMVFTAQGIAP
ncbi:MAG: AmmeMemoRadiSam system protein B [Deltaproteobacteria bacterium]|nr:AmmeMemoRadiSam system protein B [Deltaproteobacteria bacterium]